jgi:Zn-dependent protease
MLGSWWVANVLDMPNGKVVLVSWVVLVIGSIILHELAHGWAAIHRGDRTPIELGHMTWNPMVHMGQTSLILFLVFGIAFGAMPVNPSRMRGKYAGAYVAAAGPAMNLLLAIACMIFGGLVLAFEKQIGEPLAGNSLRFFSLGVMLNVVLMLFNLLPIPPLDGSRILADFSPSYAKLWMSENAQWVALGLFLLVFFFAGDYIIPLGFSAADLGISFVAGLFS